MGQNSIGQSSLRWILFSHIFSLEQIHFPCHGTPYIEGTIRLVVLNEMRSGTDGIKGLCYQKMILVFFIHHNTMIFCVIHQIYSTVTCDGVRHCQFPGQHVPLPNGILQIVMVDHLIVIAIHQKIGITDLVDICGNTQITVGICNRKGIIFSGRLLQIFVNNRLRFLSQWGGIRNNRHPIVSGYWIFCVWWGIDGVFYSRDALGRNVGIAAPCEADCRCKTTKKTHKNKSKI